MVPTEEGVLDGNDIDLPHAVALSWGVAEQPHRGPKRELSIERIVETAIEIADAEGLSAVSMNRVATTLGFTTMSLYRYVTSKDDLLLLMQDAALDIPVPPEPESIDWRGELAEWAHLTLSTYRVHPWFGDIPLQGAPVTPHNMRIADWGLRCLRGTELDANAKLGVMLLVLNYTRSYGTMERDLRRAVDSGTVTSGPDYAETLGRFVTPERFPYLAPIIQSGAYTAEISVDSREASDFRFGLDRVLDGIALLLAGEGSEASTPSEDERNRRKFYPKDERVREAANARREAEQKLREALKKEREALAKARERLDKGDERAAARAEKAAARERRAAERRDRS